MKTDGILFDLDGTLWDATETFYDSWKEYLTRQGVPFPHTMEAVQACMGLPMTEFFARLHPGMPKERQDVLREGVLAYENTCMEKRGGILYPGVRETLALLQKSVPLMIVSNCQAGYIEAFFKAHEMGQYFTDWESFGGTGLTKAENIALVVERNHLQHPVYVGDVQKDADAAHEAGVPIVYAAYGFGHIADAEETIAAFSELPQVLEV
jgi:phosphoglycolate phosphatase